MGNPAKTLERQRTFKNAVLDLRALTADDLEAVNGTILDHMQSSVKMIPEVAGHLINAGGKRLRPVLTIAAARAFGYDGHQHINLAAAVELIHGATLLHDDVVDESALRRGLETANIIWGNKESVLVGDFLFSRSFELMVKTGSLKVLDILSAASCTIAEGEVLQLATQKNTAATFEMYLDVVKAKTAALFAAATQAGAVIAGASEAEEKAFFDYGMNFGIAYQLVDDALDYAGTQSDLGKSVGDDFREGKMTLPVVHAISAARNDEERAFWQRTIGDVDQKDSDLPRALELMQRDNIIPRTLDCAREFADEALASLRKLPQSDYTTALADLVDLSVARNS
uniref:Octaprenyl diphosphate synthase n=1 Tax=Aquisalinus luteolus TaxID=1566827 RepID=A0A8J3A9I7_9PROT|nr:farnesyltranstransferase [Aquisalinus luteolus]